MEKLAAVFRATLDTFRANPIFGKVVLKELDLATKRNPKVYFKYLQALTDC